MNRAWTNASNLRIMKAKSLIKYFSIAGLIVLQLNTHAQPNKFNAFQVKVSGKGQPMILLPGATCSGAVWDETVSRYSKKYQCHVITLAGYAGVAPLEKPPYLDTYKNQIIKYITENKLNHVILVGHSIGGFISLSIAAEAEPHLDRVIVVDALPFYADVIRPGAINGFNEAQAKSMLDNYNKMDDAQLKATQLQVTKALCADSSKWNQIATWGATSDRKTMAYTFSEMLGYDLRQKISAIKVPVLVMAAFKGVPQYPQFTQENVLQTYRGQYSKCNTCVVKITPASKHFIMYDEPAWFNQEMDSFLK
jgi:N-formylmaleamate deformylase